MVDTSALVAVVLGEPDAETYLGALTSAETDVSLSAATLVEARVVVEARQGPAATADLRLLVDRTVTQVVPFDEEQCELAAAAWRRFGKGRHPAALNLGDTFSYALAVALDEPLLFKGGDFSQTDVRAVLG